MRYSARCRHTNISTLAMKSLVVLAVFAALAVLVFSDDGRDVFQGHSIVKRAGGCDPAGCTKFCRSLGHARGVCIGTYCQCRMRRRRSLEDADLSIEESHVIEKRDTIQAPLPFPPCVFYECIAKCRRNGYKNGGYCTINGCQCVR